MKLYRMSLYKLESKKGLKVHHILNYQDLYEKRVVNADFTLPKMETKNLHSKEQD